MKKWYYIQYDYKDSFGETHVASLEKHNKEDFTKAFLDLIFDKEIRVLYTSASLYENDLINQLDYKNKEYYKELRKQYQ